MNWDRALNLITTAFNSTLVTANKQLPYFLCFGSLLKMVRDKGKLDGRDDIDIGVFYEDYEQSRLEHAFKMCGLQIVKTIIHDVDRKPLYYQLQGPDKGMHYCVFAWIKHKNIRFHTYDFNIQNKKVPSPYVFKGVPAEALESKTIKVNFPGTYRQLPVPTKYGTLFDIWYPDWMVEREGVSDTKWQIEMKSCSQFKNDSYKIVNVKWPSFACSWQSRYEMGKENGK